MRRVVPLITIGLSLLTGCRTGTGKESRPLGTELTATQFERQIRTLDSIETALGQGPGSAARVASADSASRAPAVALPLRPMMEDLALPDSASAGNSSALGVTVRPQTSLLRASPVQSIAVPAGIAPAPLLMPAEVLAPLWALAPLAGATSVTRATVTATSTVAVVPEPSAVALTGGGVALLMLVVGRQRRATRAGISA